MCQQINCVRKKEDGEIVEGSDDDIRANSYVAAFQREYNEEKGELNWKIVDFRLAIVDFGLKNKLTKIINIQ